MSTKTTSEIRAPAVAGMFYPGGKVELAKTCAALLEDAKKDTGIPSPSKLFGIVSPHAGYPYSGYTAAHGYSLLSHHQFESVVVISPSHHEYFDGVSVYPGKAYSTPLGEIEIDVGLRAALLKSAPPALVAESQMGHRSEHAVEVQLPFLQLTLKRFKLLPLVMGDQKSKYCRLLGESIAKVAKDKSVLVVASSDLSHYYDYDTANKIDKICIDNLTSGDAEGMLADLESGHCQACGGGPITSLLIAGKLLGFANARVLHHCNSGDSTGDKSSVVGYLSAIIS